MTLSAHFADPQGQSIYAGELASTKGWADFSRWADGLDVGEFHRLIHLCEHGWTDQLDTLETMLTQALHQGKGIPASVRATGEGLLAMLKDRGNALAIVVSDGTAGQDDSDEDDQGEADLDAGLDADEKELDELERLLEEDED